VQMDLRDDAYFCKPVTGLQGDNINASQLFFNAWLSFQVGDAWDSTSFIDLHHIDITGTYSYEIYFNTLSYWNTYYGQGAIRPMDTWLGIGPNFINHTVETFTGFTGPDTVGLAEGAVWIDYVSMDATPLTMFTDYNIVSGDLEVLTAQGPGTLEVSYWYIATPTALTGTTPGSQPWETILEGAGQYYAVTFSGLDTGLTLKRNPYYYAVTPPLGEIDFVKKSSGNYKIDIFDLVLAGGAFGSQGTGVPDSNWFAGADLAPNGGVIDIYDEVTITGTNWDVEFDPIEP
jgi:hypothetical protein